jgi:hypothetical protein
LLVFQEISLSIHLNIHRGSPTRWRLAFIAVVALWGLSSIAHAQTAPAQAPAFRSAFDGYKPYTDDGEPEWIKANDAVRQAGGWRAYSREAQGDPTGESQAVPPKPAPATPTAPSTTTTPTARPDPHAGHAKP